MDRNEVLQKLKTYIATELLNDPNYQIGDHDPLITGGTIDSFALARIGVFIEDEFGIFVPDDDLTIDNMDTVAQMTDIVYKMMNA
jgi:acyl carrier protein